MIKVATIFFLMLFLGSVVYIKTAEGDDFVTDGLLSFWTLDKSTILEKLMVK